MTNKRKNTLSRVIRKVYKKLWGNRQFRVCFKLIRLTVLTIIAVEAYGAIVSASTLSQGNIQEDTVEFTVIQPLSVNVVGQLKEDAEKVQALKLEQEEKEKIQDKGDFTITAYDLSFQSCEKDLDDPWYGITASGYDISGMTREEAMVIAVDPTVIPLGSKVRLTFYDDYHKQFNGVYTARDVGGAIKGKKIDLFMGDFEQYEASAEAMEFGVIKAKVEILLD